MCIRDSRQTEPAAIEERSLVDDIVAAPNRSQGVPGRAPEVDQSQLGSSVVLTRVYACGAPSGGLQTGQVAGLVLDAAPGDQVYLRVQSRRLGDQSGQGRQLEAHEVLAGQEADQVRCGKDRVPSDQLHRLSRYPLPVTGRVALGH